MWKTGPAYKTGVNTSPMVSVYVRRVHFKQMQKKHTVKQILNMSALAVDA